MDNSIDRLHRGGTIGKARISELVALRMAGCSVSEIAQRLQVSTGVVSRTLQLQEVIAEIQDAQLEARSRIVNGMCLAAVQALEVLQELALGRPDVKGESPPANVRRQAAVDILNRAGLIPGAVRFYVPKEDPFDLLDSRLDWDFEE